MNGSHLVPLQCTDCVFSPDWGLSMVVSAYDHVLFGPETMLIRTLTLNALMYARYRVAADKPYPVQDRRHKP